ncbi:MAG: hypothetical protein KGM24_09555 [Elusimicrobia bacterium]|nr:hypothetical protein [Elusimicrobiota bacterium]
MPKPDDSAQLCGEFDVKWKMGVRGAAAVISWLETLKAEVELQQGQFRAGGADVLRLLLMNDLAPGNPVILRARGPETPRRPSGGSQTCWDAIHGLRALAETRV